MGDIDMVKELEMDIAGPYAISKSGVNMVVAKYNALYRKEGILFIAICPGSVDTDAQPPAPSEYQSRKHNLQRLTFSSWS